MSVFQLRLLALFPCCAALLSSAAWAASYAGCGLGVQPSRDPDRLAVSETTRQHYQSVSQDYLRTYLRDSLKRFIADSGVAVNLDSTVTSATLDVSQLYARDEFPLKTKFRVLAKDDVQQYLHCGLNIPIKLEMDSVYQLLPDMQVHAGFRAPFDDLFQAEFGSCVRWSDDIDSRLTATLRHGEKFYTGVSVSTDVHWNDWHLALGYNLTPDAVFVQSISLGKNF